MNLLQQVLPIALGSVKSIETTLLYEVCSGIKYLNSLTHSKAI